MTDQMRRNQFLFHDRADFDEPSVFLPAAMLRETRRQRQLLDSNVPDVCLLDPDGDVVRQLANSGRATRSATWACYHTELWLSVVNGMTIGIVGCAVGASFAVLVAEQLFASGCTFLISITSAGQIDRTLPQPCMVLIDRALRGEGTSYAYLPQSSTVDADPGLIAMVERSMQDDRIAMIRGTTWTTDAPYRETATALSAAKDQGAVVVEMEAAALCAFAAARHKPVVCFAHMTNSMAVTEGDFEKGPADGVEQALIVVAAAIRGWQRFVAG
jgi:uridine phosphorylase